MEPYVPDMLDELSEHLSKTDPYEADEWRMTTAVADSSILRTKRGVTEAELAKRMDVSPAQVTEIESRPWAVSQDLVAAYLQAVNAESGVIASDLATPA